MTQRSVMTGSIFEPSPCCKSGYRFFQSLPLVKRCSWQGTRALAIGQFLQSGKRTGGQCVLLYSKKEVNPLQPQAG